ncbi:Amino Acid/Auxin Permease (AAAP) Family [Phytophthora nicotianae]|uniref:Amino Acid/Auxin Permease (AAAP) Family n=1 Tax=Phytophthora nicotianae TaxID=4792 RepID=A0A0W8DRD5_PHYNI|nr:Amino Acid/Auxin Permease (AAAP) Family [Phytophthora nicotianae]
MERSIRRDRSRDPEDDASSDTGASTRLRRRMRSMVGDSTSDGADTDASSAGQTMDEPQRRPSRRGRARKTVEDTRKSMRNTDEHQSPPSGDEYDDEDDDDNNEVNERRQRSLSNVSNTSSTSGSSLTSEPLTEEQRRARAEQQMAELEQKKKMVEDGTLAEFCRRVAAFKEERNRLLQTAELHKNLQLKNGQDLYKFEVQRAHHLWKNDRKELKEELLGKVDAVMAKLQTEMKALSEPGAKIANIEMKPKQKPKVDKADKPSVNVAVVKEKTDEGKKTSEPEQEEGEVPEPPATTKEVPLVKRRKMDPTAIGDPVEVSKLLPVEAVRLPFDDVNSDIAAIVGDHKKTAQASVEQLPNNGNRKICVSVAYVMRIYLTLLLPFVAAVPFKLERRRLFCGKNVFEDGDEVHVTMPLIHEEYTGRFLPSRTTQSTSSWHQARRHASCCRISSAAAASLSHCCVVPRPRVVSTAWAGQSTIRYTKAVPRIELVNCSTLSLCNVHVLLCFSGAAIHHGSSYYLLFVLPA